MKVSGVPSVLFLLLSFFSLYICIVTCQEDDAPYEGFLRAFPNANISDLLDLEEPINMNLFMFMPPQTTSCPLLQPVPDTSDVGNLRPGNIKVVMAMGDSITAGMSVHDSWVVSLKEYRGTSFSIGADADSTVPNFLSKSTGFKAFGASSGNARIHADNGFNAAIVGAKAQDMPSQAKWLVEKLKASPSVNMTHDWKLLTIWIGSNNLCDVCKDDANNNGANYEKNLVAALQYLYDHVPRVFVNLVAPLNVAGLWNVEGLVCSTIHVVACPCAGSIYSSQRDKVTQVAKDYVARSYVVAKHFKKSDFAVVVQPFLQDTIISDRGLLSKADCFHPSEKGHAVGAVALWNNMLTPSSDKKTYWDPVDVPICPSDADKFFIH